MQAFVNFVITTLKNLNSHSMKKTPKMINFKPDPGFVLALGSHERTNLLTRVMSFSVSGLDSAPLIIQADWGYSTTVPPIFVIR